jgi:lysophospholipase L1-like esterase
VAGTAPAPQGLAARGAEPSAGAPAAPEVSAPPKESLRPRRVAALGDSLTDSRSGGGGYLEVLRERCKLEVDNFGRGGDMVNQMRRRFEREILPRASEYGALIVFGGVNDLYSDQTAGRTVSKIQDDLRAIYEQAKASGLSVIAITVAPWGGFTRYWNERRGRATLELNAWISSQVGASLTQVVDAHTLLACEPPERLCVEYERKPKDGLHFNQEAQRRLGDALVAAAFSSCE